MSSSLLKRIFVCLAGIFVLWISTKYLFPLISPFLFGGLLALVAEPLVSFGQRKLHLSRSGAAGFGVGATLLILLVLLIGLGALLVRELLSLADSLPDLEKTTDEGISVLQNWAVNLTNKAPEGIRPALTRTVENTFSQGNALMDRMAEKVPVLVGDILSGVPDSALRLGTGLLAAFMISARIPRIKGFLREKLPPAWKERYLPMVLRAKSAMLGWLKAQGLLLAMIFGIVTVGFLLLRIPYGPFWAGLIALLDAVPMLGTGLVLIPWAAVSFLMGQTARAVGLLGIFACASLGRSIVEPRLLGKHLGLDPLITLIALYLGFRFFGFIGLLAAPICTAAVKSAFTKT